MYATLQLFLEKVSPRYPSVFFISIPGIPGLYFFHSRLRHTPRFSLVFLRTLHGSSTKIARVSLFESRRVNKLVRVPPY